VQTYADQVETALSILGDNAMLERIRAEGWRVILDEAQDTDPKQFAVLVEITRSPGATRGDWPGAGGRGPRPGHFCMVGDAQQGIYSARADIKNFQRHVDAFAGGDGGERLTFGVTFRAPTRVVRLLNATLPEAFGPGREHNLGLPPADGAEARCLQVTYETLVEGPGNAEGAAWLLPLPTFASGDGRKASDRKLAHEARQLAQFLAAGGPAAVGAACWGEVAILAPRTSWLLIIRDQLLAAGLKTALQIRRNRSGDNPAYAWTCGLLSVVCDPENTFEWVGVLREVFAVSDAMIASVLGAREPFRWDEPGAYPGPIADAVETLMPFVDRVDLEGESLERFSSELAEACGLPEKARWVDPEGGLEDELARLHARAAELGVEGAGPRAWLRELLAGVDENRAYGRPADDALSLLTSHSAKGLEWPVVIPAGMWRKIGSRGPSGLRVIPGRAGQSEVVFDNEGISAETRESHERERLRENVRLLYVTLTRALRTLVVPWSAEPFEDGSFADLWRVDPLLLDRAPEPSGVQAGGEAAPAAPESGERTQGVPEAGAGAPAPAFPRRVLPHQLSAIADGPRAALHEASLYQPAPVKPGIDPLEYGVWWHQTLEFVPWTGSDPVVAEYGAEALKRAGEKGFGERAAGEWGRLLDSDPWHRMREARWTRLAEAGIFAPLAPDGWIDGVIDLVLHDPSTGEVWIVDWKTNRRLEGEDDPGLLARLSAEYDSQLSAYGACAGGFFPGSRVRLWVYSTVAGQWTELGTGA
jgi:ATP-dependent exoDNAse (exonuclease V) beta subunit